MDVLAPLQADPLRQGASAIRGTCPLRATTAGQALNHPKFLTESKQDCTGARSSWVLRRLGHCQDLKGAEANPHAKSTLIRAA